MASIASTAAGDWAAGTSWVGGAVPGIGDTATLNHQITLSTDARVGGLVVGTGCLISSNPLLPAKLAVGGGAVGFTARGLTLN